MSNRLSLSFLILFFLVQFLLETGTAQAKDLHTWTDEKGVVHITETANDISKKITFPSKKTNKTRLIWAISLVLPILIRFAFLRYPLSKTGALISLVFIWLINSAVFRTIDIANKTSVVLLLISYLILCRGHKKYKKLQARQKGFGQEKTKAKMKEGYEENSGGHGSNRQELKSEKYYEETLELGGTYTVDDIKRCYRELAPKYHPDKVDHLGEKLKEAAKMEIKKINEAYEYFKKKHGFK